MVPSPATRPRRRRPSRTRTPTSSSRTACTGADPSYDYGTHFLFQGHESGAWSRDAGRQAGVHHAHQPRRRRGAPRDAARDQDDDGNPLADDRRLDLGPVGEAAALHDGEHERADLRGDRRTIRRRSTDVSGALGRGGYEGIQDDSDGNIWIVEDIGGSNKPGSDRVARSPNSFVYRYVPATPGDLQNGKLQVLQVLNESGDPITFARRPRVNAPTRSRCTPTATSFKTQVGDDPRHGRRRHDAVQREPAREGRERHAVQAARERRLPARARSFGEFFFTETGDTNATSTENADCRRLGRASSSSTQCEPVGDHRHASRSSTRATRRTPASTTSRSSSRNQFSCGRGRGRHAARAAQRARLGLGRST